MYHQSILEYNIILIKSNQIKCNLLTTVYTQVKLTKTILKVLNFQNLPLRDFKFLNKV